MQINNYFKNSILFITASIIVLIVFSPFIFPLKNYTPVSDFPQKETTQKYDGFYSDLKFISGSKFYQTFEGRFRNLTGKNIYRLVVLISFYDENTKLEIKSDSIPELKNGEDWRFKIDFVDKSADKVAIDGFVGSINLTPERKLNVISEENYLEILNYKKPTEAELAAQHKELNRQIESNRFEKERIDSAITNKFIQQQRKKLEAKYRGVRLRAESGGIDAMFELSEMLRNGLGCETNIDESIHWLNRFKQQKQEELK